MISVSAGSRSPSFLARGSNTARLWAVRTRRSKSARRPSSDARSVRRSVSARAELSADVCRAITAQSAASNATSQNAIQCRPLNGTGRLECAKLRRARAGIGCDLVGRGRHGLLREHLPQGPATAGAYRLAGGADAVFRPVPKRMLHDAVFTRMVGDDAQTATRDQRIAERGQRRGEHVELLIHGDAEGLEQTGEIGRTRARPQDSTDRIHEIIADHKGCGEPAPDDLLGELTSAALVGVIGEHRAESLNRPRIQHISRPHSPSPFPRPTSFHAHIEWRAGPERKPAFRGVDLMRADAQVEEDAIGMKFSNGGKGGRGGEGGFEILDAPGAETVARGSDCVGIAVET